MTKKLLYTAVLSALFVTSNAFAADVATFEDFNIPSGNYWKGNFNTPDTLIKSGSYLFSNHSEIQNYGYEYRYGSDFGVSKSTETTCTWIYGGEEFNCASGSGVNGSKQFAVAYIGSFDKCQAFMSDTINGTAITGCYINNSSYVVSAAKGENSFEGKFVTGDWLLLTATATKADGTSIKDSLYLIDFRSSIESEHTYITSWTWFDFSNMGNDVKHITFTMTGSHTGAYGLNTPTYFCLDNFGDERPDTPATFEDVKIDDGKTFFNGNGNDDEPTSTFKSGSYTFSNYKYESWNFWCEYAVSKSTSTTYTDMSDQYNSVVGSGANGSSQYAVIYDGGTMMGPDYVNKIWTANQTNGTKVNGCYITNTAWVKKSILEGDGLTSAFTTGDWMKITATAILADSTTKTLDFYLADYRSENASDHYYVDSWKWFDMSSFGSHVLSVQFSVSVNDVHKNAYGMTTPAYFCLDDFGASIPTGIENIPFSQALKTVSSTSYYTIDGKKITSLQKGINIIVTRFSDGTASSKKILLK